MNQTPDELLVPELPPDIFEAMTPEEQARYIRMFREQVAPCFESWRRPHRVKCAHGGRGAGAKSRSAISLLIQFANGTSYFGESIRVLCCRDVQKSIMESSWRTIKDELDRLQYTDWEITQNEIRCLRTGSYFRFNGLSDMTASTLKSMESYDILFVEEGDPISKAAWLKLIATFRKETAEIWCLFNRNLARDPCYELFCVNPEPTWSIIACRPGRLDNPWFNLTTLPDDWARLKKTDPDEARHQFEGLPRPQGERSVFSQAAALAMKGRVIKPEGKYAIGCDVARFGKDNTVAWKRKGMQIIERKEVNGYDTVAVAGMLFNELADRDKSIPILVDSGYNPGVIDMLSSWGANVVEVGFGEKANDEDSYTNAAAEMMLTLPIDEISIPEEYFNQELFEDLTERYYGYDTKGRKKLEPKDGSTITEDGGSKKNFKDRHGGRSPDYGDSLALCFYQKSAGGCW
jgi:phage terminase large subunit